MYGPRDPQTGGPQNRRQRPLVLRDALDDQGRYDAVKLAGLLDWSKADVAKYLGKDRSALQRFPAAATYQEALGALAEAFLKLLGLLSEDLPSARAWLRTPVRALGSRTPRALIVGGELERVRALLDEIEAGFAL